jgi:predicted nucleic acid-binding protein
MVPVPEVFQVALEVIEEELLDRGQELRLVVLHGDHAVAAAGDDLLDDLLLAGHRVDRDECPGQVDPPQELRDGGDLVGLGVGGDLAQRDPLLGGPGADTSTIVKRYVQETGTARVQALADPAAGHFLYVARITDVQMTAALARRRRLGSLSPAQSGQALAAFGQDFAQQYRIVEIAIPLLQEASRRADSHVLRAYDAVHLAAALDIHRLNPSLTLLSADAELNAAATAEGLAVDDPNSHP